MEKQKPVYQCRKGLVSASLFEREMEGSNGHFVSQSVALNISYKENEEFKQNSITIVKRNLPLVIDVLKEIESNLN